MKYPFLFLLLFTVGSLFAQSGQPDKKVMKAIETFNSGDTEKGIELMRKVIETDPSNQNWDFLVTMYFRRFEYSGESIVDQITQALMQDLSGKKSKMKLNVIESPGASFDALVNVCREASLNSQGTEASRYLRNFFVDYQPDTTVSETAKKWFDKAEYYFAKEDFVHARNYYKKALDAEPEYYKAAIYLGDSYFFLEKMDSAAYFFQKGIDMHPHLLEPRKYLVDALNESEKYEEAVRECLEAIYIYPDEAMYLKLDYSFEKLGRKFSKHWVRRKCEVNSIGSNPVKTTDPVWMQYQKAKDEIKQYCDSTGIIVKTCPLTKSKYMEVYAWEKMLKSASSVPADLAFAKKMADAGYLDCYIFVSVFHFDLYDQYADFVVYNMDRIKTYVDTYLTEEM